jgi:hypothetical protein
MSQDALQQQVYMQVQKMALGNMQRQGADLARLMDSAAPITTPITRPGFLSDPNLGQHIDLYA